jgi:hypothetical protein
LFVYSKTTLVPAAEANKLIHSQWLDGDMKQLALFIMRELQQVQFPYLYVKNIFSFVLPVGGPSSGPLKTPSPIEKRMSPT